MHNKINIKLAAKIFINDFKNYKEDNDVLYLEHVDCYYDGYEYLSKREKIKFIFDLFASIIDENYFPNDLSIKIYWELEETFYIYDFLTPFEIVNDYFHSSTPPMIVVYKAHYKNKIIKDEEKIGEISYKNGKLVSYLSISRNKEYSRQEVHMYYEVKKSDI